MKKIEILAPAGSFESMAGAINAGADAVYMGGRQFGARAYADNPDDERLLDAIDYVHLHGKKLYLTVNTLLKDKELEAELYAYLKPLYERGLDAVIVQDMGVLTAIRQWFPELDIHASTQMTVVSKDHARYLKALGVTRIVPARELSLEEVHRLKDTFGGEIECFVHGALCYCYSGQCLLSSMLGGRSGNRGRCAQPCRLPYGLGGGTSGNHRTGSDQYLLSPRDICTLDILPQLVECGIDSFKIEGRMKRPEYAAFVAYIYRKYTDMYLKYGKAGYHVDPAHKQALMDLYNRGGFSEGYYKMHNGREMMSLQRPNHFGSFVGIVDGRAGGKPAHGKVGRPVRGEKPGSGNSRATVRVRANVPLNKGDVLVMDGFSDKESVTLTDGCEGGAFVEVHFPKSVAPGTRVYRMRNEHLLEWIQKSFLSGENQEKIYISLTLFKDLPATMHLSWGRFEASVQGPVVTAALKQPLTKHTVEEKISKMGNTPYRPEKIEISMDPDAYLPLQALNQLRRDGVEALKAAVLASYERHTFATVVSAGPSAQDASGKTSQVDHGSSPQRRALISSLSMVETVLGFSDITRIYMEPWLLDEPDVLRMAERIRESQRQVYLALPHIFRDDSRSRWESLYMKLLEKGAFDGYLVRNMEGLAFLEDHGFAIHGSNLVADYELYTMNRRAADYYLNLGFSQTTVPLELNYRELRSHGCCNDEMIVYGYMPLMVSAQCVYKTSGSCQLWKKNGKGQQQPTGAVHGHYLVDRYGKALAVKNVCADCYNLIYNSQPLVLYDMAKELKVLAPAAVRYVFTKESPEQIRTILSGGSCPEEQFTRGHFNRGVE